MSLSKLIALILTGGMFFVHVINYKNPNETYDEITLSILFAAFCICLAMPE